MSVLTEKFCEYTHDLDDFTHESNFVGRFPEASDIYNTAVKLDELNQRLEEKAINDSEINKIYKEAEKLAEKMMRTKDRLIVFAEQCSLIYHELKKTQDTCYRRAEIVQENDDEKYKEAEAKRESNDDIWQRISARIASAHKETVNDNDGESNTDAENESN